MYYIGKKCIHMCVYFYIFWYKLHIEQFVFVIDKEFF